MKTIIIYLVAICSSLLFFGCSKDDNKDDSVEINYGNVKGKWFIKSFIKSDGTTVNHIHLCSQKRDAINLNLDYDKFESYFYYSNCDFNYGGSSSSSTLSFFQNKLYCGTDDDGTIGIGTISKLTAKLMQIDFYSEKNLTYQGHPYYCKSIILYRD